MSNSPLLGATPRTQQWLCRVHAPAWLDAAKLTDHAAALRAADESTLEQALKEACKAALDAELSVTHRVSRRLGFDRVGAIYVIAREAIKASTRGALAIGYPDDHGVAQRAAVIVAGRALLAAAADDRISDDDAVRDVACDALEPTVRLLRMIAKIESRHVRQ